MRTRPTEPRPLSRVPADHTMASRCRLLQLPRFADARGYLSVVEREDLPFPIRRFYYLYGVPAGAVRGAHAHRLEQELIIALAGSLRVAVDDGTSQQEFVLDRPDCALYVPARLWHRLYDFSPGTVCGVLASQPYDRNDYFNEYDAFQAYVRSRP